MKQIPIQTPQRYKKTHPKIHNNEKDPDTKLGGSVEITSKGVRRKSPIDSLALKLLVATKPLGKEARAHILSVKGTILGFYKDKQTDKHTNEY